MDEKNADRPEGASKRKDRLLSIRMTFQEYEALESLITSARGRRNVTQLVRTAIVKTYFSKDGMRFSVFADVSPAMVQEEVKPLPEPVALVTQELAVEEGPCTLSIPAQIEGESLVDLVEWLAIVERQLRRRIKAV